MGVLEGDPRLALASVPGLTKLTVNLVPSALEALNRAAHRLDEERTTTVNRALQLYDTLCAAEEGDSFSFHVRPGDERTVVVYDAVPAGRPRRLFTHGLPLLAAFMLGLLVAVVLGAIS